MATNVRKGRKPSVQKDLVHPKLSYQLVGILFDVWNELGPGHREKHYENAVEIALKAAKLNYRRQFHVPLVYKETKIGKNFLDFLVEDKIVLELKQGTALPKRNIEQVYAYLKAAKLKLGIIAQFTSDGVKCKRIVNIR